MAAATTSNVAAIFREIWEPGMESQFYPIGGTAWALCPKSPDWDGIVRHVTANTGGMNGVSSTFADAKAAQNPTVPVDFAVTTVDRFALWSVDHKAMVLARNDRGRQVELVGDQTRAAMERLMLTQAAAIYTGTGGAIGRIAAGGIAGSTITLENPDTIKNLEEGDQFYLSSANGDTSTDTLRAGGPLTVSTIDADAGTVTCSAGIVATIGAAAAGDYLFRRGDFQAAAAGFEAWNPLTVPSTAFYGLVRNTGNVARKAGLRKDVSATVGYVNKVKAALLHASRYNAQYTHLFVDPTFYMNLEVELGQAVRFVEEPSRDASGKATTQGFTGIKFTQHGGSPVKVYSDAFCPLNVGRGVDYGPGGFKWVSAGKFPQWLTPDGKEDMHMLESSNVSEGRAGGYGNYLTKRPLNLGRYKWA